MVDQVVINQAEPTTSEAPPTDEGTADARPDWLPENFTSGEAMAKSYTELQSSLTKANQALADNTPNTEIKTTIPEKGEAGDASEFQSAIQSFSQEFNENGQLADDSYTKLEEMGLPKHVVDGYIAGQQSIQSGVEQTLFNAAGGQENYGAMTAWAVEGLNEAEQTAFNGAIDSGDVQTALMAIENLSHKYTAANGSPPNLVKGDNARTGQDGSVYRSWKEVTADMGDPKYQKDPAFTQDVQEKLGRSAL